MKLMVFRHLWGVKGEWEDLFPRFKAKGYDGIEARMPPPAERRRFRRLLDENDLAYIAQAFSEGANPKAHLDSLIIQTEMARDLNPIFINSHSGVDAWSEDESIRFFGQTLEMEARLGLPLSHETHRGRILFNPWITSRILDRLPDLKLTCDFSHWVCVGERLLADQEDVVRRCGRNAFHIHARVGYEQGPQVPDPRAPEWRKHVETHERWWNWIWEDQAERGFAASTLTPEYGPPDYLQTLPFTREPVADLDAICDWQAERQQRLFAQRR